MNTMPKHNIYLEKGKKKVFAAAVDWPGWCRPGRSEAAAMQALLAYGPRYARLLRDTKLEFHLLDSIDGFHVVERVEGSATTDFGAPDKTILSDSAPLAAGELERLKALLAALWQGFDAAVETAVGQELRKGPRGGGRDLDGIVEHVMVAEVSYLRTLGGTFAEVKEESMKQRSARLHQEILNTVDAAAAGQVPEAGPRGGKRWPLRYYVRRSAWHVIDHIWEIEDRLDDEAP